MTWPTRGDRWRGAIAERYILNESEAELVRVAASIMDSITRLERVAKRADDPLPAEREIRLRYGVLIRTLNALRLPAEDRPAEVMTGAARHAQRAAEVRWSRHDRTRALSRPEWREVMAKEGHDADS